MRAGPRHQHLALTLALVGSGQADPRANRARPCPWTVYTQRVIGRRGTKTQHAQGSADRENVTSIITICANGTVLKPSIIFKGQNVMKKWGDNNVSNAS